jgi:hypothetical protein
MARAPTALLICAIALTLATPAAAQAPAATYVVLGGQGAVARAVIPAGTTGVAPACPAIVVDGTSQTMSLRAAPDTNFPILVCEFALPASAKTATIAGQALPLPPDKLNLVAVLGDTGCRLKAAKGDNAAAVHDTDEADEIEEGGKFQDCNNTDDWPFAPMSATIAKAKPDVVVHVGDYPLPRKRLSVRRSRLPRQPAWRQLADLGGRFLHAGSAAVAGGAVDRRPRQS